MDKPQCCKECGYLGIRNNETRELVEVDEAYREHGRNPPGGKLPQLYHGAPVCTVMAHDLSQETKHAEGRDVVEMLKQPRDCGDRGKSTAWQRGFTPKEHVQMQLLEQQQAWQRQMAEDERAWRERQEERARAWRKEDLEEIELRHEKSQTQRVEDLGWRRGVERNIDRRHRWVYILTALAIVVSLVAAAIQAGLVPIPWLQSGP